MMRAVCRAEGSARQRLREEDALLRLAAVVDVRSLRDALRETAQGLLPSVECVCVYVLERDSRLQCDDPSHELPKEGKIRYETLCV
ncbi:cGMP-dependent 3',5'-cyclic phosphodiesterase-like [Oncorhynchus kisutch]|uniref:cGMP-dependent 3',5'-cyclic phosphodiesterase-like n=1 Tax=Oncorhynchus kisutch TaxID=8019 RepID=UPI0012DD6823|nr:cGMP-dependent 3',5'-cyclic phosphodiesterase-like [Oncorhynchus kisutch]XP_031647036.1 cGMP-dependent 3',5'-cyclic phosphodiesterase-like [Oncorhynchus kisutch]